MADAQYNPNSKAAVTTIAAYVPDAYTAFGARKTSGRGGTRGVIHVKSNAGRDLPSMLLMDAVADTGDVTTFGLWVDSTGDLRIISVGVTGPATVTNQDGDGTVVGTQT